MVRIEPSTRPVSEKAMNALAAMRRIQTKDATAMANAQELLDQLVGERCTVNLVRDLKEIIQAHGWGVACPCGCGQPAVIAWIRRLDYQEGGVMRVMHYGRGQKIAKAATIMPNLTLAIRQYRATVPSDNPISEKAAATLARMAEIEGKDASALAQAGKLFAELVGERCTMQLVAAVNGFLIPRSWGVQCPGCGIPSRIEWANNKQYAEGGGMRFPHRKDDGKWTIHGTRTFMPQLKPVVYAYGVRRRSKAERKSPVPISEQAATVLADMAKIEGTDSAAMAQAQVLVNKLAGEHCTKELVSALKRLLKAHNWRVRCPKCGRGAPIGWHPASRRPNGGAMRFRHAENGKPVVHGTETFMPAN